MPVGFERVKRLVTLGTPIPSTENLLMGLFEVPEARAISSYFFRKIMAGRTHTLAYIAVILRLECPITVEMACSGRFDLEDGRRRRDARGGDGIPTAPSSPRKSSMLIPQTPLGYHSGAHNPVTPSYLRF